MDGRAAKRPRPECPFVRLPPRPKAPAAPKPSTVSPSVQDALWQRRTAELRQELSCLSQLYARKAQEREAVLDAVEAMIAAHDTELSAVAADAELRTQAHRAALAELRAREGQCLAAAQRAATEEAELAERLSELLAAREHLQEDLVVQADALEQLERAAEAQRAAFAEAQRRADEANEKERAAQDAAYGLTGDVREMVSERERVRSAREAAMRQATEMEVTRRQLYAQCEELKGTIRVYCRAKGGAEAQREGSVSSRSTIGANSTAAPSAKGNAFGTRFVFPQSGPGAQRCVRVCQTRNNATSTGRQESAETFTYDRVFDGAASQADVYADVEPLVNCAIDGYRVCIFAYGQTGSGKTYSMEGDLLDEERCGITPRALRTIFRRQEELRSDGWSYKLSCYFVEIYNDVIRDLQQDEAAQQNQQHAIKHNSETGSTSITGVVEKRINSLGEFYRMYSSALRSRSTAKTKINDRSSRSHCLFVLRIEGENSAIRQRSEGTLCLVDLAGSERVNESGAQGQQFKEAVNINRSLLDLGKCISALHSNSVAPWRNCKLTYMLQNYLGARGGKMLMIVTVSDKEEYASESINSLRFASRVNQTVLGPSVKQVSNY